MKDVNNNTTFDTTFDTAYNTFYRPIYTFAFCMLGNTDDAEDASQETFMKLHNHLSIHPPLDNTKNWLYRVASNICLNYMKRQKLLQKILTLNSNHNNTHHPSRQNPVEQDFIRKQEQQLIRNAMNKLPKREQTLLVLYRDKFSYADIAEILNMKKSSVGKILARAREKLVLEIKKGEIKKGEIKKGEIKKGEKK